MQITINVQRSPGGLWDLVKKSPDITARAINRTLEEGQAAERGVIGQKFVDRQGGFLNRMVKISAADRATSTRVIGRVRIVGPEGSEGKGQLLARHEEGGVQRRGIGYSADPVTRTGSLWAIPTKAIRPNFADKIPRKLYLPALHLQPSRYEGTTRKGKASGYVGLHHTSTGKPQIKGADRTFILFGANGGAPIGVFQRKGGKRGKSLGRRSQIDFAAMRSTGIRDDIRLIWAFRPTITLKPRLSFYDTITHTYRDRLAINYQGFLTVAMQAQLSRIGR